MKSLELYCIPIQWADNGGGSHDRHAVSPAASYETVEKDLAQVSVPDTALYSTRTINALPGNLIM